MKNSIKSIISSLLLASSLVANGLIAAESKYEIRADGLACPYCAYGIEKKFMLIDGVTHLDIDLKKGLVIVTGEENLSFQKTQLETLFTDSGFTFRTMKKIEQPQSTAKVEQ